MDKLGNKKDKLIELRFINSFKFMATSFDSLTRNLVGGKGGEKLFGFENYSELQYKLLSPEKGFTHMNICRPGIDSRIPNSFL